MDENGEVLEMVTKPIRRGAWMLAAGLMLATAVPTLAASTEGSVTFSTPHQDAVLRGIAPVEWTWKSGSVVRSTSKINVQISRNGFVWTTVAKNIPIRIGACIWDTTPWPDGVYAMRITVSYTSITSETIVVMADNTAPVVRITRPARGQVTIDDEDALPWAVAFGRTTLEAEAQDASSGVLTATWFVDDEEIGTVVNETRPPSWLAQHLYDFSQNPGEHTLSVVVADGAGNQASATVDVMGMVGPSAAGGTPDPGGAPSPDPSTVPSPDPSTVPSPDPGTVPNPDPSTVPNPDPSTVPNPDPSTLPNPDPGALPPDPDELPS